jgi:hypothetical protein
VLCRPFFSVRCSEFGEKVGESESKHVRELALQFNALCCYVTLTVLVAADTSTEKGSAVKVVQHWLAVAEQLLELRNYHMAFAVQCGLAKHQVDRLTWLGKGIGRKASRFREKLNELFDQSKRMQGASDAFAAAVEAGAPCIPVIFWFVQKATLLAETPVLNSDGTLNTSRIVASGNIFNPMIAAQSVSYDFRNLNAREEVVWFLQGLERGVLVTCDDDMLYKFSDAVKSGPTGAGEAALELRRNSSVSAMPPIDLGMQHSQDRISKQKSVSSGSSEEPTQ